MRNLSKELQDRNINYNVLEKHGFIKNKKLYIYEKNIFDDKFKIIVTIDHNKMISKIIDNSLNEEYLMADIKDISGSFVGTIKETYDKEIKRIIQNCTFKNVFKNKQSKEIIEHIQNTYHDELEYLWEKFPKTAIWRNKQNQKWYGLMMSIPKNKLGIDSNEEIEIIDLRYAKDKIEEIIDYKKIYPGYHMNKHSWITILLDDSINTKDLLAYIDNSYHISLNK